MLVLVSSCWQLKAAQRNNNVEQIVSQDNMDLIARHKTKMTFVESRALEYLFWTESDVKTRAQNLQRIDRQNDTTALLQLIGLDQRLSVHEIQGSLSW